MSRVKVYITRHGEVPHNAKKEYNSSDEDLTEYGQKQSRQKNSK